MISISHTFKSTLESALKTGKDVRCGAFIPRFQEIHCQRGYKSAGEDIRGKHGKDYRLSEGNKEIARYSAQEEHGEEDDTDAECRDQCRNRDLGRAIEDG